MTKINETKTSRSSSRAAKAAETAKKQAEQRAAEQATATTSEIPTTDQEATPAAQETPQEAPQAETLAETSPLPQEVLEAKPEASQEESAEETPEPAAETEEIAARPWMSRDLSQAVASVTAGLKSTKKLAAKIKVLRKAGLGVLLAHGFDYILDRFEHVAAEASEIDHDSIPQIRAGIGVAREAIWACQVLASAMPGDVKKRKAEKGATASNKAAKGGIVEGAIVDLKTSKEISETYDGIVPEAKRTGLKVETIRGKNAWCSHQGSPIGFISLKHLIPSPKKA